MKTMFSPLWTGKTNLGVDAAVILILENQPSPMLVVEESGNLDWYNLYGKISYGDKFLRDFDKSDLKITPRKDAVDTCNAVALQLAASGNHEGAKGARICARKLYVKPEEKIAKTKKDMVYIYEIASKRYWDAPSQGTTTNKKNAYKYTRAYAEGIVAKHPSLRKIVEIA